jgi:muramoyltetrapeptide carboxypeptidase
MTVSRLLLPRGLQPGDRIGIIAPSFPLSAAFPKRFEYGLRNFKEHTGLVPVPAPHTRMSRDFMSAEPVVRAREFLDLVEDPSIKGILTTIGGANSTDMLPLLDVTTLKKNPKVLMGYSDTTSLLLGVQALADWVTFYGPAVMTQFGEYPGPLDFTLGSFRNAVFAKTAYKSQVAPPTSWTNEMLDWAGDEWATRPRKLRANADWQVWREGSGGGVSFGGNLDTLNFLVGTPFIKVPERITLFWETCDQEASLPKLRRALTHLRQAGIIEKCGAMLVGRSPDSKPTAQFDLRRIVLEVCADFEFPIIGECAFGHTDPMLTLPIGVQTTVSANSAGQIVSFARGVAL